MLIKKELATIDVLECPEVKGEKNQHIRYACTAEVFELPRSGKVLVVDIFKLKKKENAGLAMRFFTDAKTFATCNEWPAKTWGNRNPGRLEWCSYFYSDPSDDELVNSIIKTNRSLHKTVISVVDDWVSSIQWEKRKRRELAQRERSEKVSVQSVLGIDKQQLSVCRSMNVSLDELQIMRAYGKWISEDDLEEYRLLKIPGKYSGLVGSVLKNMSFEKFLNYFRKQRLLHFPSSTEQNITWYRDYIEMSEVLGVDLSRKSVRYPQDIKEAHDRLMLLAESVGNEEVDAAFARVTDPVAEDLGMYSYESKMFCIVVPQTRAEFIAEGQSLSHCVGRIPQYYNNHVAGTKMIFFVRKVSERDKPFFTMEVDMQTFRILQLYGYGDCNAKRYVKQFAEGFVNALRKSREKGKKTA